MANVGTDNTGPGGGRTAGTPPPGATQGLSGYYTVDKAGNIVFISGGTPPTAGGHWEQWYTGVDGTWSKTQDDGHMISFGVWVADTGPPPGGIPSLEQALLTEFPDMPADLAKQIDDIFKQDSDAGRASQRALALLRGSDWYAQKFPGIGDGFTKGMFSDEAGYRQYLNDVNVLYRQYYGRDVTGAELASYLGEGVTPTIVGERLQGAAIVQANQGDWQQLAGAFDPSGQLTGAEKTAYGQEQAGLDSPLGQAVMRRLAQAQKRFEAIFSGQPGTPNFGLGNTGLAATSLSRTSGPDTSA